MFKYIFIIQCLDLKCNLIYLLDFGRFNTLSAISFWLQKAKKDTAAIVNAGSAMNYHLCRILCQDQSGKNSFYPELRIPIFAQIPNSHV
jgi:hypothetical protein